MANLDDSQYRRLYEFGEMLYTKCEPECLPVQIIEALSHLLPADCLSYNHFSLDGEVLDCVWTPVDPVIAAEEQQTILGEYLHEHPFIPMIFEQGFLPTLRLSDLDKQQTIRKTALYHELYRPLGIEYQMCTALPLADHSFVVFAHSLSDRDYTDTEKQLCKLAMPYIKNRLALVKQQMEIKQLETLLDNIGSISGKAIVLLTKVGEPVWLNAECAELFALYFEKKNQKRLPEKIRQWLEDNNKANSKQSIKMEIKNNSSILSIRFIPSVTIDKEGVLLLEEQINSINILATRFDLSRRETEVLEWVAKGKNNSEIATVLDIRVGTIKKHLEKIYKKLGVKNRTAAASLI